jgi:hypothetical protein
MTTAQIESTQVPEGTLAATLGWSDYVDAYRVEVDPALFPDVEAFARAFLQAPPPWVRAMMRARDGVAVAFGLKSMTRDGARQPVDLRLGGRAGIFRVVDRTEREIVLGEDDRHLDFRLSLIYQAGVPRPFVTVVTRVRFHNALGRAYFAPVAPLHRRIVPAMMRRAVGCK